MSDKTAEDVFVFGGEVDESKIRGALLKRMRKLSGNRTFNIPVNRGSNFKKAIVRDFEDWVRRRVDGYDEFKDGYLVDDELYAIVSSFYEDNEEYRSLVIENVNVVETSGKELGSVDEFKGNTVPDDFGVGRGEEEEDKRHTDFNKLEDVGIVGKGGIDEKKLRGTIVKFVDEVDSIKGTTQSGHTPEDVRQAWSRWMLDRVGGEWPKFEMKYVEHDVVEEWIVGMCDEIEGLEDSIQEKYEYFPEELEGNGNRHDENIVEARKQSLDGWNDERVMDSLGIDYDDGVGNGDIRSSINRESGDEGESINIDGSRVINGDSIDVISRIEGSPVNALISDPPFGQDYDNRTGEYGVIEGDSNVRNALNITEEVIKKSRMIMSRPSPIMLFCGEMNLSGVMDIVDKWFDLHQVLVWDKDWIGMSNNEVKWRPKKEFIVYGWYGDPNIENENRHDGDIITFQRPSGDERIHPTEKPVDLMAYLVESVTEEGDRVMDPFAGSGSTLLGARRENREYLGIELDEKYYNEIQKRLSQGTITSW